MTAWQMPNSISPSRMSAFLQCPLRFRIETMQKLPQKTGAAAVAGTTIHAALELLMAEEPGHRTRGALDEFVSVALEAIKETDDYKSLEPDELKDFDAKVRRVAPRAFDIIEVQMTEVAGLELTLEVDLDGWILRGIIDLLEGHPGELAVRDWKSGRTPSERYSGKAMLGLDFYSVMASIEFDEIPREVSLLYLESRTVISKEPTERSVAAMKRKILAVRDAIDRACEQDSFKPNVGKLCDWCGAKPYCPAHGGDPSTLPVAVEVGRPAMLGSES